VYFCECPTELSEYHSFLYSHTTGLESLGDLSTTRTDQKIIGCA
jgi:hypothetical protein